MDLLELANQSGDKLTLKYCSIATLANYFLIGNSKKHDIGGLVTKFQKYGFVEPIKIDPSLNKGKGAIVGGNGRIEALLQMYESGMDAPRGIAIAEGIWLVPVIFGVNAKNEDEAIALSIDLNWSVLEGGNFSALDATRLFDSDKLLEQLQDLSTHDEMITAIDNSDFGFLVEQLAQIENNELDFQGNELIFDKDESTDENRLKSKKNKCPNCDFEW